MRQIILDTETTGLDPVSGHRIVEIGCIEVINYVPSGKIYQQYINPLRDMPEGAFKVHGLSEHFLRSFPTFDQIVHDFLNFIGQAPLVIHNANFDMTFLNHELERIGHSHLEKERVIDTLALARKKFPGARASLDALCKRFQIDLSGRVKHGALLDSELLSEVYLHLMGGRQPSFITQNIDITTSTQNDIYLETRTHRTPRQFPIIEQELEAHEILIQSMKNSLWTLTH